MGTGYGLWTQNEEKKFFIEMLKTASPEDLFYLTRSGEYYAYWPKNYRGRKTTLQSRNALVGIYTEKWCQNLLRPLAAKMGGQVVRKVVCEELELTKNSPADLAICKTDSIYQKPEDIMAIFEIKMSIVWNWKLVRKDSKYYLKCVGDPSTHQGNPGLLRSDTMLKAIGKSINIRLSGMSAKVPIVIIGNTPITQNYSSKVDNLKKYGIIQGFWSLNPSLSAPTHPLSTPKKGFLLLHSRAEIEKNLLPLLRKERIFFAGMKTKKALGRIIEIANRKRSYEAKAEKFLELVEEVEN